jgi:hypothetical protein
VKTTIAWKVGRDILANQPSMTMEEWARACARYAPQVGLRDARESCQRYRARFIRRCNANGLSIYPIAEDGRVSGILHGNNDRARPTYALARVDDLDDPKFLEYTRHIIESGNAQRARGGLDLVTARRRGQITSGALAPLIGPLPPLLLSSGDEDA